MQFSHPRHQGQKFFEISWFYWIHLMVLEKVMSYFWKLKLRFWTYGFISCCKRLKFSSTRPQTPNVTALGSNFFFMSSSIKFCMKQGLIFKFWVIFDKVMSISWVIFHVKSHNPPHLTPMDFVENFSGGYPSKN